MEVTARIQFTRPCLGNVRKPDFDRLLRDPDGEVIFLATWWRSALSKAAQAINKYHTLVDRLRPALPVRGPVSHIKRWYGNGEGAFKVHEGFDAGATVTVQFLLPSGMTLDQFTELLETVGLYVGISPYGWKTGTYGQFKVLEVVKSDRKRRSRN
jgi:hypothetical protein